jgi:hypothetical protein
MGEGVGMEEPFLLAVRFQTPLLEVGRHPPSGGPVPFVTGVSTLEFRKHQLEGHLFSVSNGGIEVCGLSPEMGSRTPARETLDGQYLFPIRLEPRLRLPFPIQGEW